MVVGSKMEKLKGLSEFEIVERPQPFDQSTDHVQFDVSRKSPS